MKSKVIMICLLFMSIQWGNAQTPEELFDKEDYVNLVKYADKAEELTGVELYYVGYAFFQLANDTKAIEMYDKAIAKGEDESYIYWYKGLALRFNKQSDESIKYFKLALDRDPLAQRNHTELGNTYFYRKEYDTALIHYERAIELPYEHGEPYMKLPYVYHITKQYDKALEAYRASTDLVDKNDPIYVELLREIGGLEYSHAQNLDRALAAYEEILVITPENYDIYNRLIKIHYAQENYAKGDSLFAILKSKYEEEKLPEALQKIKRATMAEFQWEGQRVIVYKYFEMPKETLDLMYLIFLVDKNGESVERVLMTEKTVQFTDDGAKHLLCEEGEGGAHYTYPVGWNTDEIPFDSLKEAVLEVLNGEMEAAASSIPATNDSEKDNKKNKKKKRNEEE